MPFIHSNSIHSNSRVMQKTLSMMVTVPQVMASRLWMYADPNPDNLFSLQQECQLMVVEKQQAFFESVQQVQHQLLDSQMQLAHEWMNSWQSMFFGQPNSFQRLHKQIEKEAIKVVDKSITPYSKRVKANNKRLNG